MSAEIYEIDDSGHTLGRKLGTRYKKVRGYVIGCFGIRHVSGWWKIDHLPTGARISHEFKRADDAAFVCMELICRARWAFTMMPSKKRLAELGEVYNAVGILCGDLDHPCLVDQTDKP